MTPIETKLYNAAAADVGLQALLGTNPFRLFDTQLDQGSAFPALVMQEISSPRNYVMEGQPTLARYRVQFTIWGGQFSQGRDDCDSVRDALYAFLADNFSAVGNGQIANQVASDMRVLEPRTDGPIYKRIVDAFIYSDDSLS